MGRCHISVYREAENSEMISLMETEMEERQKEAEQRLELLQMQNEDLVHAASATFTERVSRSRNIGG